jgi:transposase
MPRKGRSISCTSEQQQELLALRKKKSAENRMVMRATIVSRLIDGATVSEVADDLHVTPITVRLWRDRFIEHGIDGLEEQPRPGKPQQYGVEFRDEVLKTLEQKPPHGMAVWDGPTLAGHLNTSVHAIWRLLRKENISLARQRSWCVSTDPEFVPKAADIVGLYLNPPEDALVLSIDEKPSMQALERRTGYVKTSSGKIVHGLKSTYKRHGTLNLFAALDVATGHIYGKTTQQKRRPDFQDFMEDLLIGLPPDQEIHVILHDYCIHKRNDDWLVKHPNVEFHYTPTSASWLNLVEVWFGIFSRKVLRGASFTSTIQLREAIEKFVDHCSENPRPFVWKKREVKGSQLRNTVSNLRN